MKKFILGAIAAAAVVAPIAISAPANAAPGPNHGQCVSSAVKAGVTGDAFKAIAQNNALVGEYGSATCPAPVVVIPTPDKATSDAMTWDFNDGTTHVTGTTTFNVDKDGNGALVYSASDGHVLYGTVTPGSYQKLSDGSAIFSGTIDAGSFADYLMNPSGGGNFFTAKVVDGGAPQNGHGDMIAVLANQVVPGTWITSATDTAARAATIAYPMGVGTAGIVVTGNLTID